MFSTRLRVMLLVTAVLLLGLFARAVQVQWVQHEHWVEQAKRGIEQVRLIDTSRGRILDYKGRELALDQACIDAVVDYRVITQPADAKWVRAVARSRLLSRLGRDYLSAPRAKQNQLIEEQMLEVRRDIDRMWEALGDAGLTGVTAEQVEDRRQQIMRKVQMQQRYTVLRSFARAKKQEEEQIPAWWEKGLVDGIASELSIDSFDTKVKEQEESHVVLPAISNEVANYLGKQGDRFPGLSLRPGQHRVYPYGNAACHAIGYLSAVSGEDIKADPEKAIRCGSTGRPM